MTTTHHRYRADHFAVPAAVVAAALEALCDENADLNSSSMRPTVFDSKQVPPMTIADYTRRIVKHSQCSDVVLPLALIYIHRYIKAVSAERGPQSPAAAPASPSVVSRPPRLSYPLTRFNVHRLLITACAIAAKEHDDIFFSTAYYASVGGVHCQEMVNLELQFLLQIHFDLWVDEAAFVRVADALMAVCGGVLEGSTSVPPRLTAAQLDMLLQDSSAAPLAVRALNDSLPQPSPPTVILARLSRRGSTASAFGTDVSTPCTMTGSLHFPSGAPSPVGATPTGMTYDPALSPQSAYVASAAHPHDASFSSLQRCFSGSQRGAMPYTPSNPSASQRMTLGGGPAGSVEHHPLMPTASAARCPTTLQHHHVQQQQPHRAQPAAAAAAQRRPVSGVASAARQSGVGRVVSFDELTH